LGLIIVPRAWPGNSNLPLASGIVPGILNSGSGERGMSKAARHHPGSVNTMRRSHLLIGIVAAVAAVSVSACGRGNRDGSPRTGGEQYGKYILHAIKYDGVDKGKAKDNAADVLTQLTGEANVCMIGLWAYNPPAILMAAREAGRVGQVKIVAFDEDDATLLAIQEGSIHATVVQQPFKFGYESVRVLSEMGAKKIGFVTNVTADFWTIAEAGTRQAATDLKVEVQFRQPRTGSPAEQQEIIEDFLNRGVDGIAVSVNNAESQTEFINKVAERVPLICHDNDAPKSKRRVYIGTDNYKAGKAVGELVKEVMPQGGKIAIFVGKPDAPNAVERREGVLDALKGVDSPQFVKPAGKDLVHVPHRVIRKNNPEKENDVLNFTAELKRLMGK
jgi:ribose transport system substrate-binding protein